MSPEFKFSDSMHPSILLYNFDEFRNEGILSDVTLNVGPEEIRAHKVVLAAASPFFRLMFISDMKEARQEKVSLSEIESKVLKSIVTYIYTSEILVTEDNVYALMEGADFLQLPGLLFACQRYLLGALSPANCLSVCVRARLRHAHDLARQAFQYALDNFDKVVKEEEFVHAPPDLLLDVLSARTVHVTDEEQLLESVVSWTCHDEGERAEHLGQLLGVLRLHQVPSAVLLVYRRLPGLGTKVADALREAVDEALAMCSLEERQEQAADAVRSRRLLKRQRFFSEQEVILGVGGQSNGVAVGSVECFTLGYDTWRCIVPKVIHESGSLADSAVVAAMSCPRLYAAVASADNHVYVAGGSNQGRALQSVECYSAESYTWRQLASLPAAVEGAGAVFVDGCLHVAGGMGPSGVHTTVWKFEAARIGHEAWRDAVPMSTHRAHHGVVCVTGVMYAIGGVGGSSATDTEVLRTAERYNPVIGRWQAVAPMLQARSKFGCVAMDEYIYVMGGCVQARCLKTVERYNTLTNEWTPLTTMSFPRSDFGATVCSRRVYCLGGHDSIHQLNTVEKYNPRTDRWHCVSSMQVRRLGLCAATVRVPVVRNDPI